MTTTKTQAVLLMYDFFLSQNQLAKKDFLGMVDVSDISFKRYVTELRAYFADFNPSLTITYSRKDDMYYLTKGDHRPKARG